MFNFMTHPATNNFWKFVIILLELHSDQWLNFMKFCVNKTPQTSRTFWRIFAEFKMVVVYNSTILASIPISPHHCFSFFGVIPNAPTTTGMLLLTYPIFYSILFSGFYNLSTILSPSLQFCYQSGMQMLIFGRIYYCHYQVFLPQWHNQFVL